MAPAEGELPGTRPTERMAFVDEVRIHPHDDIEAHYASLERPCACFEGWVFVGYEDEHGEEEIVAYRCRRC
jgi:hypothetical protein